MSDLSPRQKDEISAVVREAIKVQLHAELDTIVLKTVSSILTTFGMNDDDRADMRDDFAYLRRWRKTSENISRGGWIAIMTVLVSGFASAIWLAAKTAILVVKGGG